MRKLLKVLTTSLLGEPLPTLGAVKDVLRNGGII